MPPSIFDLYVSGGAQAFFPAHYADEAERRRAVARATRPLAAEVASALLAQNARLPPSAPRDAHLQALRGGAAAVVTGQQVGLFLGPLYTIYKAATAIVAARALSAETGQPVVPVFWLQTEDHDLPEIATCYARAASAETLALQVPAPADERVSIAHRVLPAEVTACLDTLQRELGGLPHAAEHLARMRRHYRPNTPWSTAFAGALAELFADEGLVLIDPRDPALGCSISEVHRRALVDAKQIAERLLERSAALSAAGFEPAVHIRPDSPLCFVHPDAVDAGRHRLVPEGNGFRTLGAEQRYSTAQLLDLLQCDPLRFSSSALLRPIVQDTLLPTAMYVGGPGEVAYFAQLAPLYASYAITMPVILPRARFRIIDDKTAKWLARLGIDAGTAALGEEALLARISKSAAPTAARTSEELQDKLIQSIEVVLREAQESFVELRTELAAEVVKTRAALTKSITALTRRYQRLLLHRAEDRVLDLRRVRAILYPRDTPQERIHGFSYFAARYGERPFLMRVLEAIEPFQAAAKDLTP